MEIIPLFYWPTTLMMVDNNIPFLENLSFQLRKDPLQILYQNPLEALEALQTKAVLSNKIKNLAEPFTTSEFDLDEATSAKNLNYQAIINLIYEKDRFSTVSTVLVDYGMPQLNGVEFCRKIKNFPIKKIMLTGEAGNDLAVAAFNEKLIDSFVVKDIKEVVNKLNNIILGMKQAYFSDISLNLIGSSINELKKDQNYLNIFTDFINDHHIDEYYQIDSCGSYLGFDSTGNPYWLVIRPKDSFNEALDIMKYSADSHHVSAQLKEKSHLLFLFSEVEKKLPISSWENFLFPVLKSFNANGKLYYSTIIQNETFSLEKEKIMSFHRYLQTK